MQALSIFLRHESSKYPPLENEHGVGQGGRDHLWATFSGANNSNRRPFVTSDVFGRSSARSRRTSPSFGFFVARPPRAASSRARASSARNGRRLASDASLTRRFVNHRGRRPAHTLEWLNVSFAFARPYAGGPISVTRAIHRRVARGERRRATARCWFAGWANIRGYFRRCPRCDLSAVSTPLAAASICLGSPVLRPV